jgi:DNA modification methylase
MQLRPIAELLQPNRALRRHSQHKQKKLTKHIDKYGVLVPLLVEDDGRIVDGVARYLAAKAASVTHVNTISVSHLAPSEIRALRLALNRFQEEATWDKQAVAAELKHLIEIDFNLDLTGLNTVEIESYLEIEGPTPGEEETLDVSSLAKTMVSQAGDIWILSSGNTLPHRLACGDSHDPALLALLFKGKLSQVAFSDFPYNLKVQGFISSTGRHAEFAEASGEMSDAEFVGFLETSLSATFACLDQNAVIFGCIDWRHVWHLVEAARRGPTELLNIAVWVKTNGGQGSFYRSQHELICVFKRPGATHRNNIELGRHGRSRTNVWNYRGVNVLGPERYLLDSHPTVKPVAMVADAIRDVTQPGEIAFDNFLGSGTSLIAAERTKRVCYGVDIEPKYIDLAIRRWQVETGRDAVRLSDGVTFSDAEDLANQAAAATSEEQS